MTCPRELQSALLEILYWTMLEVRSNGQDERYCSALAEHAHNIPHLIDRYSPEQLFYYWECERLCFIRELERYGGEPRLQFQQQWDIVKPVYERIRAVTHIAPAIVVELDSGLVDIVDSVDELNRILDPSREVPRFQILDRDGTERILTLMCELTYECDTKRADLDEIRGKLLMFGSACEVFDPTQLQTAEFASEMFDAYLRQHFEDSASDQLPVGRSANKLEK